MVLTAIICMIAIAFALLACAYWRAPYFADLYSGHASTKYHPVMAGRYLSFAGFAAIAAIWGDARLTTAIFGLFALTALMDFLTYIRRDGHDGNAIAHFRAFIGSIAVAGWAYLSSGGVAP